MGKSNKRMEAQSIAMKDYRLKYIRSQPMVIEAEIYRCKIVDMNNLFPVETYHYNDEMFDILRK